MKTKAEKRLHARCAKPAEVFPGLQQGGAAAAGGDEIRAVDDISFRLKGGETLGIVGESGSGKTTASRAILRAIRPTGGEVWFESDRLGRVDLAAICREKALKPLRQEMQMIFQDPFSSLNPRMTVGDIVGEPLQIHNLATGSKRRDMVAEMLEKVGLLAAHKMQRYPHAFSGGQRQRIGIARALIMRPKLIVADEAVSALDVSVQAQVINLLQDLQEEFKLTYLFVAHDLSVVRHIWQPGGRDVSGKDCRVRVDGGDFSNRPQHPYTKALLSAIPSPDPDEPLRPQMVGEIGDANRFAGHGHDARLHED